MNSNFNYIDTSKLLGCSKTIIAIVLNYINILNTLWTVISRVTFRQDITEALLRTVETWSTRLTDRLTGVRLVGPQLT